MRRRGRVERWRDEEKAAVFVLAFATCLFLGYFVQKLCIISHREKKNQKACIYPIFHGVLLFVSLTSSPFFPFFQTKIHTKFRGESPT